MARFITIDCATPHSIIFAYRGDDPSSLARPLPPEEDSIARIPFSPSLNSDAIDQLVSTMFIPVALANRSQRVLIREGDDHVLTAWIVSIET